LSTSTNAPSHPVEVERRGAALVLTIHRPEAGNSVNLATAEGLSAGLERARAEAGLRAVIITGAGGKFFCTGGDVKAYRALESTEALEGTFGRVRRLLDEIEAHPLPVLAAIEGYALGGGLEMALACDQRFAGKGARLGLPQTKLGLIPGWNGVERLVETVGRSHAMRLLYLADPVSSEEALRVGLVDDVTEDGGAVAAAVGFAERLTATAPLAIEAAKAVCIATLRHGRDAATENARKTFARLWFTTDHREAEAAFAERRKPQFHGR
jgi:enoyl-CoA hydratase/carnithine racemase